MEKPKPVKREAASTAEKFGEMNSLLKQAFELHKQGKKEEAEALIAEVNEKFAGVAEDMRAHHDELGELIQALEIKAAELDSKGKTKH